MNAENNRKDIESIKGEKIWVKWETKFNHGIMETSMQVEKLQFLIKSNLKRSWVRIIEKLYKCQIFRSNVIHKEVGTYNVVFNQALTC